jgi:polysaccharide export outer membrane protein
MRIIRILLNIAIPSLVLAIPAFSLAHQQADPGYIIGPEDVIDVTVIDQPKFSGEYVVPPSGVVDLPVAGDTKVTGMSLNKLRDYFTIAMKKRLVKPEVTVTLKSARPQRVYVFGDVRTPGIIELKQGWTVSESLSAAGGLIAGIATSDVNMTIEHVGGGDKTTMPLDKALNLAGDDKIKIAAGDVIRFDAEQLTPIYVSGDVKTPGLYKMKASEAGVMEALTQAGGVLPDANLQTVRIIRLDGPEQVVDLAPVLLRGQKAELPRLKSGDMVLVAQSTERFAILGYVSKPGYYNIPSGQKYTLIEALALANGPSEGAKLSQVGIVSTVNGKEVRKVYDIGKFRDKGDASNNPELHAGDVVFVPQNNAIDLRTILSFLSPTALLYRAVGH